MKTTTKIEIVVSAIATVMIVGTLAYHSLEGWGYVDSFYFTGITVTTIGYGDLYPITAVGKIFTVFFAFGGVSIMLFSLSLFATHYFERRERRMGSRVIMSVLKQFDRKEVMRRRRKILEGAKDLG